MPGDHRPPGGVGNMLPKTVTDDVRKSDQRCIEAVVSFRADESALDIQESLELGLGMMKASGARPPVRAREDGLVAVLRPDTFQLSGNQVNDLVPRDLDERVATALSAPAFQPTGADRGVEYPRGPVQAAGDVVVQRDGSGSDGCPRTDVTRPLTVVTSPIPQWLDVSARSTVPSTSVTPGLPVEENAWHIARELSLALPAGTWLSMSAFPAGCHPAGRGKTARPGHTRAMRCWLGNSANRESAAHISVPAAARTRSRGTSCHRPDLLHTPRAKMTAGLVKATKTSSVVS